MDNRSFLVFERIVKGFSGVVVLNQVSFRVNRGEVHAIVGENGAGKSTLMKILAGVYPYGEYSGSVMFKGVEQHNRDTKQAEQAGISIIYQELELIPNMTVCENIFLGNEPETHGVIDYNCMRNESIKILQQLKSSISPDIPVEMLSVGQQQIVAIAKAISKNVEVIIFDEPTSALPDSDALILFDIIRSLKNDGITCLYISHKINRVLEISDTITVLRDGKSIITAPRREFDEHLIIKHMVGRDLTEQYPRKEHFPSNIVMEVRDLSVFDPAISKVLVDHVSFTVKKGEILGFAGLMGAGRTELFMGLFGAYERYEISGTVFIHGQKINIHKPYDAIKKGIGLVVEDRKERGLVMCMDIIRNSTLANIPNMVSWFRQIDSNKEIRETETYAKKLSLKYSGLEQLVQNLSGGNQQKVVIAKSLMTKPDVLILDEPTRGIDVKAKHDIYEIMNDLIDQGVAIVMISSELSEVIGMADRILVMCEGRLTGELSYTEATQERIMQYATASI
ncbi:sugar ABC transporter ATP-binding protein [Sediminispirochaeta smaragdinae]|uniref:ABC transporter related protein n=1 Tax=Sediminispirochaeta smaragdinae (strain DSM 11293 / JCM 15392 / SEBR 4228) TaxID=573413 RepID=E1R7K4_SEDSS|nr:ATP-binding cassette domain-containing protein [Sediminispirochaeta smaragdinae]ADK82709.1 ABC transporter related protein [Sediminispirochaeta smaragdinae DSM 11293]